MCSSDLPTVFDEFLARRSGRCRAGAEQRKDRRQDQGSDQSSPARFRRHNRGQVLGLGRCAEKAEAVADRIHALALSAKAKPSIQVLRFAIRLVHPEIATRRAAACPASAVACPAPAVISAALDSAEPRGKRHVQSGQDGRGPLPTTSEYTTVSGPNALLLHFSRNSANLV